MVEYVLLLLKAMLKQGCEIQAKLTFDIEQVYECWISYTKYKKVPMSLINPSYTDNLRMYHLVYFANNVQAVMRYDFATLGLCVCVGLEYTFLQWIKAVGFLALITVEYTVHIISYVQGIRRNEHGSAIHMGIGPHLLNPTEIPNST